MNPIVAFTIKKLDNFLTGEYRFLREVKVDVECIKNELKFIHAYLRDAERKQEGNERVRTWISEIRDIAYKTEDVIDTFALQVDRAGTHTMGALKSFTKKMVCISGNDDFYSIGKDIEKLKHRMEGLAIKRVRYGIGEMQEGGARSLHESRMITSSADNEHVVGFGDDFLSLETELLRPELSCRVVSIVGMGGLGKTTLARKLYNMNKHKFKSHAWICVSHNWESKDLVKRIIKSLNKTTKEKLDMDMEYDDMVSFLREFWLSSKCLLVIDDLWSKDIWQSLEHALPENGNGSRIIVTTHIKSVAQLSDKRTYVHELRFLRSEESWELFREKSFPGEGGACPQDLQELGQQMVEKCGGLPLAIIVVGGLLSIKRHVDEWQGVERNLWFEWKTNSVHVAAVLEMSNYDLPPQLHLCFLYLGLFPKGSEIDAEKLLRLWVAEDFIPHGEPGMGLEESAEKCLKDLSDRCLIQVVEMKIRTILTCRVHEFWRNQAIDKAKDLDFLHVHGEAIESNLSAKASSARRIVIHSIDEICTSLDNSNEMVRTLAFLNHKSEVDTVSLDDIGTTKLMASICTRFKLLRVLELKGAGIAVKKAKMWLSKVCETLILLKYLGLEDTYIDELPKSICKLKVLQTLYVDNSSKKKPPTVLPREICKLKQLRHLIGYFTVRRGIKNKAKTVISPRLFGELTNLRSLGSLDIHGWQTRKGDNALDAFTKLQYLKILSVRFSNSGNLSITPLFNCRSLIDLEIYGRIESLPKESSLNDDPMPALDDPMPALDDPMPALELLPKLLILRIADFNVNTLTVTANGFPKLEELELSSLGGVTTMQVEEGAMPNLELIRLDSVNNYCFPHRFGPSITRGRLVGNRRDIVPTSAFPVSARDILANKVMVATIGCEDIANKKFQLFSENETWKCLEREVQTGIVASFGRQIDALMNESLTQYDREAAYFDREIRDVKQKLLQEKLLQLVKPVWDSMMERIRSETIKTFKEEIVLSLEEGKSISEASTICTESLQKLFDDGCKDAAITLANWDTSDLQSKLRNDIAQISEQTAIKHEAQLPQLRAQHS